MNITPQTFNEITFNLFTLAEQSKEESLCISSLPFGPPARSYGILSLSGVDPTRARMFIRGGARGPLGVPAVSSGGSVYLYVTGFTSSSFTYSLSLTSATFDFFSLLLLFNIASFPFFLSLPDIVH